MSEIRGFRPKIVTLLAFFVIFSLALIGCGKQGAPVTQGSASTISNQPSTTVTNSTPVAKSSTPAVKSSTTTVQSMTPAVGNVVRLKSIKIVDPTTGIEALSMLIPTDWNIAGGVNWILDNPIMPATVSFRVSNPKGSEVFELFPSLSLFWTNNQGLLQLFPVGSKYFGSEVGALVEPGDAFSKFVLPRYRSEVSGPKVVSQQVSPDVGAAPSQQSPLKTSIKGGQIRLEYLNGGKLMEDGMFCKVEAVYIPIQGLAGTSTTNVNWAITNISSFSTEKGKLDSSYKIFETISRSVKLNPQWFSKFNQVVAYLIQNQIQKIQSAGELSRILAQTSDQISNDMMQSYNDQQAINDKIADNFDQYVRGVDSYYDPIEQKRVELPSGYDNAWTNANGDYIVAESPSFNPNVGSNLNWQPLKKN
jgi:hypothetical protein